MISFVFLWLKDKSYTNPYYVEFITSQIARHTSHECDFVCVTDQAKEPETWTVGGRKVRAFPVVSNFPRHQHKKLELFREDLGLAERAVMTDLDNFIVGSLDELLTYSGKFGARQTFKPNERPQPQLSWAQFHPPSCHFIWERARQFKPRQIMEYAPTGGGCGDQLFVYKEFGDYDKLNELFPGQLESWKRGYLVRHCPNVRVLFAHGRPKPHQMQWRPDGQVDKGVQRFVDDAKRRFA